MPLAVMWDLPAMPPQQQHHRVMISMLCGPSCDARCWSTRTGASRTRRSRGRQTGIVFSSSRPSTQTTLTGKFSKSLCPASAFISGDRPRSLRIVRVRACEAELGARFTHIVHPHLPHDFSRHITTGCSAAMSSAYTQMTGRPSLRRSSHWTARLREAWGHAHQTSTPGMDGLS